MLGSPLRIPEGELGVSFAPKDLPKATGSMGESMRILKGHSGQVRVGVMEDGNKAGMCHVTQESLERD